MQRFYQSLLLGLSLLVGLTSCSQEATREKARPAAFLAAAGSIAAPAKAIRKMPEGGEQSPGAPHASAPKHLTARWGKRPFIKLLQASPQGSIGSGTTAGSLAQQPAALASVGIVGKSILPDTAVEKPAQIFRINPDRDTLLVGAAGTAVWVPAQVFAQNGQPLAGVEVQVRLREFYTLTDIVLQRLSTTAGPALLETAGMVQLMATANGQACTLKRGSSLAVSFPTRQVQENMQLFYGVNRPGRSLDWRPAASAGERAARERAWRRPMPARGYGGMRGYLQRQVAFTAATAGRLAAQHQPRQVRRWLRHLHRGERRPLVGAVVAAFELSASGQLTDVRLINTTDAELATAVQQALRGSPRWRPATTSRGLAVRSQLQVEVLFTADQRVLVEHLRWDEGTTKRSYASSLTKRQPLTDAQLHTATAQEVAAYVFQTANLGWLNCDQFLLFTGRLIRQRVAAGSAPAEVSLVLKARRSIMGSSTSSGHIRFERVPEGEAATLVAIRRDPNGFFLAIRDIIIGQQEEPPLAFKPLTANELKAAVDQLELVPKQ